MLNENQVLFSKVTAVGHTSLLTSSSAVVVETRMDATAADAAGALRSLTSVHLRREGLYRAFS